PLLPPPNSLLFPYTPLFRSALDAAGNESAATTATLTVPSLTPPPIDDGGTPPADPEGGSLVQPWTDPELTTAQDANAATIAEGEDRKSTRLNSSHQIISYAV